MKWNSDCIGCKMFPPIHKTTNACRAVKYKRSLPRPKTGKNSDLKFWLLKNAIGAPQAFFVVRFISPNRKACLIYCSWSCFLLLKLFQMSLLINGPKLKRRNDMHVRYWPTGLHSIRVCNKCSWDFRDVGIVTGHFVHHVLTAYK